jgi:protein-S-isoprenylcysteine O-methyltransferase Ste14
MASDIASSSAPATSSPLSPGERFTRLCVRRRVPITIGLLVALLALDGFVFNGAPRDVLNWSDPLVVAGELLILAGLLVRAWAAGTLRKQKQLATTGPYACIRHPLYFGSILMMVGFGALGFAPLSLAVIGVPMAWLYWQAMVSEERHVGRLFPHEWPHFAAATPRLIPRRLAIPRLSDWSLAQWLSNTEYQAWIGAAVALAAIKALYLWSPL